MNIITIFIVIIIVTMIIVVADQEAAVPVGASYQGSSWHQGTQTQHLHMTAEEEQEGEPAIASWQVTSHPWLSAPP